MNFELLQNSVVLVVFTTVLALVLAVPAALAGQLLGQRGRRWVVGSALLTLALPAFFVSGMWMEHVGFAGAWRVGLGEASDRWMPIAVSSGVLALLLWPIGALLLLGAWDRLDSRHLEAEPALRGGVLLARVLWPCARSALLQPAVIIGVLALGNFSVPALFQARVWPAEVWVEYSTRFDAWAALRRCWPLLILLVAGLALLGRRRWAWPGVVAAVSPGLLRERLGVGWTWAILATAAVVWVLALGLPIVQAVARARTWTEFLPAIQAAWPVAVRTILYAAVAATGVLAMALWLVERKWVGVMAVTFVVPGVFTGIVLAELSTFGFLEPLKRTGAFVVAGLGIRYLFVGWLVARQVWRSADSRLREWGQLAGAGRWAQWRHVVLPGSGSGIAGAWFVVYLLCLWDVETQILVVPPGGDTLGLMIFNLLHYGHNAQVTALCVLLGILAILPRAIWGVVRRVAGARGGAALACLVGVAVVGTGCSQQEDAMGSRPLASALFERVEVIGARGTGPGFFSKPRSLAVDEHGSLFVVDMTGRVQRFGPDGRWMLLWQMLDTTAGRAKGMEAAPGGGVFVVEPHYHRVNRYDGEGRLAVQWGVQGTNAGQLWFPRAIASAGDGTCFVSEYGRQERVQRFRLETGEYVGGFGGDGTAPGQLNRAEGLGVGPGGEVYVADSCNHRIQVFSLDGRLLRTHGRAGRGPGEFSYPYDVRVDADGRQYVCEFGNSRVQILGPDDRTLEILGGPGEAPDEMNNPWSLCLDRAGNLYVADSLNHRVLKYVRRGGRG